jgi:hypothetical protein
VIHARILAQLIELLDEDTQAYANRLITCIEKDPRLDDYPNMPFLVLRETLLELPTYLDPEIVSNLLFSFVIHNVEDLKRTIHSQEYLHNSKALRSHCTAFVIAVVRDCMKEVDLAYEGRNRQTLYRLEWPIDPEKFPYIDDEDGDEDEDGEL